MSFMDVYFEILRILDFGVSLFFLFSQAVKRLLQTPDKQMQAHPQT